MEPKPIQKPHPPIWWGGASEKSRELVADLADGWLPGPCTIHESEENMDDMRKRLEARGRDDIQYGIDGWIYMGRTDDEAEKHLKNLVGANSELYDKIIKRGFVGSPETIAERIKNLEDIGVDYIILEISPALKDLEDVEKHLLPIL
jgi:alkanesulfonate monooxygenase SsuD/methylene tetrahydromethanopterin reductase-like flavin-dependent oxidoreductase (luciferase family)